MGNNEKILPDRVNIESGRIQFLRKKNVTLIKGIPKDHLILLTCGEGKIEGS